MTAQILRIANRLSILLAALVLFPSCGDEDPSPTPKPPVASFAVSPMVADTGAVFTVDASLSSDPAEPLDSLDVRWDWDADGTWDTEYAHEKTATRAYSSPGARTIVLEVRNQSELADTARQAIRVRGSFACLAEGDTTRGRRPLSVDFSAAADGGSEIFAYTWVFGDGAVSFLQNPAHTYDSTGTYDAILAVQEISVDDSMASGAICFDTVRVEVLPQRDTPIALLEDVLPEAFLNRDSVLYEQLIDDAYQFNFIPEDAESLRDVLGDVDYWGKTADLRSTGALFRDEFVTAVFLNVEVRFYRFAFEVCDDCLEASTNIALDVLIDPSGGSFESFKIYTRQNFLIRPDPDNALLWIVCNQTDFLAGALRAPTSVPQTSWGMVKRRFYPR